MPIKFRCPHCAQFLGISRSKAGAVTDCPTCGRTIRVPNLDGKVAPLPPPTLSTRDTELARALDQLASLSEAAPAVALEQIPPVARAVPVTFADAPVAQAIQVSNTPNTGTATDHTKDRSSANLDPAQIRPIDPLAELAASPIQPAKSQKRQPRTILWMLLFGVAVGLLLGFVTGRITSNSRVRNDGAENGPTAGLPAPSPNNPPVAGNSLPEMSPDQEGLISIEGRVTYLHASGEGRPDQGARVLVLPVRRAGTTKLPASCFQGGVDVADFRVAQAATRALGGDFASVDSQGLYQIRLPERGKYHLIIVSRYQGRPADGPENVAASSVLKDWLDQPRAFFGQTRSVIAEIDVDGQHPTVRDHHFTTSDE